MSFKGWWLAFALVVFPGFLTTAATGMLLTWIDRFVSARVQWRKGPPVYQPLADFLKLLLKQVVVPAGASRLVFLMAPLVGFAGATLVSVMLPYANFSPGGTFVGDIIVIVYLFALPPLAVIAGASASRNPVAAVGASREMTLYFAYELPFVLALLVPIVKILRVPGTDLSQAIRLGEIVAFQQANGPFLYSVSGVIAGLIILLVIQAKLGYVPFDMAEAEQEIMSGVFAEYSGAPLAVLRLTRAMMFVSLPLFAITVLWGGFADWWAVLKFLVIVVLTILIRNTNPRLRVDQALKLFWFAGGVLGILAVVLAYMGL
ncbi:MAG: complex I subunit 1 family protein [candidate division WOR-3 bacterium]